MMKQIRHQIKEIICKNVNNTDNPADIETLIEKNDECQHILKEWSMSTWNSFLEDLALQHPHLILSTVYDTFTY